MIPASIKEKADTLRADLNYHSYRYYVLSEPVITDREYDDRYRALVSIEASYPTLITPDSPTQRIGSDLAAGFQKVSHERPILSLANAFSLDELEAWELRNRRLDPVIVCRYVVEPKFDGLTIVLRYEDGVLVRAATRGNGETGDMVTANARTVRSIPLRIPVRAQEEDGVVVPDVLTVRGEVLFEKAAFEVLNRAREEDDLPRYVNARNTASGSLKQKDARITATRPLTAYVYDVVYAEGLQASTRWEQMDLLRQLGFLVPPEMLPPTDLAGVAERIERWASYRAMQPFEMDGLVIKLDDLGASARLGVVGKDPRAAIAFKFPSEEATTQLLDVVVNVGRTGKVTPTATLEPIFVGGVTVSSASLHNYDHIAELDIRQGDTVIVTRSGDVIPYVVGPVPGLRDGTEEAVKRPTHCPYSGDELVRAEGMVDYFCPNTRCPERLFRYVEFFVSRGGMTIDGLGPRTIRQLIETGLLTSVADIFFLQRTDLMMLDGFGVKKVDNLLAAIDAARARPVEQLVASLGIAGVGTSVARLLMTAFPRLADLAALASHGVDGQGGQTGVEATTSTERDAPAQLLAIEGIGPALAGAIGRWFASPENLQLLDRFQEAGLRMALPDPTAVEHGGNTTPFAGRTFVITGTLPSLSRAEAAAFIRAHGGTVTGTVSRKTSYVVVGDKPGNKAGKARQLGIPMIDEPMLKNLTHAA